MACTCNEVSIIVRRTTDSAGSFLFTVDLDYVVDIAATNEANANDIADSLKRFVEKISDADVNILYSYERK